METKRTNKDLLVKGIQNMGICVVLMFLGPTMLHLAFSNPDKPTYILVLIIAIVLCLGAIFFLFRGIYIIMQSLFKN
ncbi:hypothetical protein LX77_01891 [Gelidibacter algens]|jgi:hypothetical protein|uniref:Uncharacterized protein n=1 Tax=Gelidibacter algens TaxID=49280 RepID=A0A1A7R3Y9_9FLAO|nr:DUF6095 family protein [Gelidibacter algens]OBX26228.1 hypothetical protein A9996_05480 [Gelidibacter algens]RAJ24892.1 hypothetical protein LX77_01891 [Gelidibacter algens]